MTADSKTKGSPCEGCEEASEEELLARLDEILERYKDSPGGPHTGASAGPGGLRVSARGRPQAGRQRAGQIVQRGGRSGELLLLLLHHPTRQTHHKGLPGHGLLRARRPGGARRYTREAGHRRGPDHRRPAVLARSGALLRSLRSGAGRIYRRRVHRRVRVSQVAQILSRYSEQEEVIENVAS